MATFEDVGLFCIGVQEEIHHHDRPDLQRTFGRMSYEVGKAHLHDLGGGTEDRITIENPAETVLGPLAQRAYKELEAWARSKDLVATYAFVPSFEPDGFWLTLSRNGRVLRRQHFPNPLTSHDVIPLWLSECRVPRRISEMLYKSIFTQLAEAAGLSDAEYEAIRSGAVPNVLAYFMLGRTDKVQ